MLKELLSTFLDILILIGCLVVYVGAQIWMLFVRSKDDEAEEMDHFLVPIYKVYHYPGTESKKQDV